MAVLTIGDLLTWQRRLDEILAGAESLRYVRLSLFVHDFRTAYDGLYERVLEGLLSWTEYDLKADFPPRKQKPLEKRGILQGTLEFYKHWRR